LKTGPARFSRETAKTNRSASTCNLDQSESDWSGFRLTRFTCVFVCRLKCHRLTFPPAPVQLSFGFSFYKSLVWSGLRPCLLRVFLFLLAPAKFLFSHEYSLLVSSPVCSYSFLTSSPFGGACCRSPGLPLLRCVARLGEGNLPAVFLHPLVVPVPSSLRVDRQHYRHFPEPNPVRIHSGGARPEDMNVIVCLQKSTELHDEIHAVHKKNGRRFPPQTRRGRVF
jgi:hypothetical protein